MSRPRCWKPTSLRWQFLGLQILTVAAAIIAVAVLYSTMPNTNDSAFVDGQQMSQVRRSFLLQADTHKNKRASGPGNDTTSTAVEPQGTLALGGHRPTGFSRAKLPTQYSIAPNRTEPGYNTAAATTSDDPLQRETSDFFAFNHEPSAVTTNPGAARTAAPTTGAMMPVVSIAPVAPAVPVVPATQTQTIVATLSLPPVTTVITPPPRTTVSTLPATITTIWTTFAPMTAVTTNNGVAVTTVFTPAPRSSVKTVDPSVVTLVYTPPPETKVMAPSGSVLTLIAAIPQVGAQRGPATGAGGAPAVLFLGNGVAGTSPTGIIASARPITTSIPTTISGRLTTVPLTLIPVTTAFATTINGTPTTVQLTLTLTPTPEPGNPGTHGTSGVGDGANTPNSETRVYPAVTPAQYFAASFLPPLLAILLSFPACVVDHNVKHLQPFAALTRPGGATGPESMTLHHAWLGTVITPTKQLFQGQPIPLVASLIMWLSWLTAPLAAEAVGLKIHGVCSHLSIAGCTLAVGVSPWPARALLAVLGAMLVLLVVLAVLLRRWDTGVARNPWSVDEMAILSRRLEMHTRFKKGVEVNEAVLAEVFRGRFFLDHLPLTNPHNFPQNSHGTDSGSIKTAPAIIPHWQTPPERTLTTTSSSSCSSSTQQNSLGIKPAKRRHVHVPFATLTYPARALFTILLLGLITLLSYYHTCRGDTPFELFMDSQTFGVKFLFAAVGTVIALYWSSFFLSLAALVPFRHLACTHTKPSSTFAFTSTSTSISSTTISISATQRSREYEQTPPTNPLTGTFHALRRSEYLLLTAALMSLSAELLPTFLSNIPYALTQTYDTHRVPYMLWRHGKTFKFVSAVCF
ncbi:hypothetical protein QBC47DRAFT_463559 [Echria macrotheca]|uniref:Uncharacterized protein n=1 Tax=Echria macrotheca TaxID=438768 RepID=A0AAJ0F6D3_9PEZI|nr:hypothetical protein QBC47DRAFT_463559 [Echria macrotheca]